MPFKSVDVAFKRRDVASKRRGVASKRRAVGSKRRDVASERRDVASKRRDVASKTNEMMAVFVDATFAIRAVRGKPRNVIVEDIDVSVEFVDVRIARDSARRTNGNGPSVPGDVT